TLTATAIAGAVISAQSDQETGTAVNKVVTPGRQQFHPSAAKGWAQMNISGSATASYNVSSITDQGTGLAAVSWGTDFSSVNYGINVTKQSDLPWIVGTRSGGSGQTAGTTDLSSADFNSNAGDPTTMYCAAFGDQ